MRGADVSPLGPTVEFRELLLVLVLVWVVAKLLGEAMERVGQTAVLGELLAGVLVPACSGWYTSRRCCTRWRSSASHRAGAGRPGAAAGPAANVVLGAPVVDDVLGLIILAVVTGAAQTSGVSAGSVALLTGKALVFLVAAILLGLRLAPLLVAWIGRLRARGTLVVYSLAFAMGLAALADLIGLATINGALAAGLARPL